MYIYKLGVHLLYGGGNSVVMGMNRKIYVIYHISSNLKNKHIMEVKYLYQRGVYLGIALFGGPSDHWSIRFFGMGYVGCYVSIHVYHIALIILRYLPVLPGLNKSLAKIS
jgi:hypothetical protein